MTAKPLLTVENVRKQFGPAVILDEISFDVAPGEVVVVLGPSGAGKSMLLRAIAGLEGYEGRIAREGELGMLFQGLHLFPHLTALENVSLAPREVLRHSKEKADAEALALLTRLKMQAHATKHPSQLSGGQQQRVAIARALALSPRLMLFDEPTSALDPESISDVLDAIGELAQAGMTLLIVTHQLGFARKVANRILFLDHGKILETATPEAFFGGPRHPRSQAFLDRLLRY